MLSNLKNHIKFNNHYSAIEITEHSGNLKFQLLALKKSNNTFKIGSSKAVNSFEEIASRTSLYKHSYLIINNSKVLSKSIHKQPNIEQAVKTAFPNINLAEFYYQAIQLSDKTHICIIRKEEVFDLIQQFKNINITVIGISLGNTSATVLPSITSENLTSSNASLSIDTSELKDIVLNKINSQLTTYHINGIHISSDELLCFSTLLKNYLNLQDDDSNLVQLTKNLNDNFIQKKFILFGLKSGLIFLFISLLINFLVFNHYSQENNLLNQNSAINNNYKQAYLKLKGELDQKKKLADQILNGRTSKASLYFDKLGASLPKSITLSLISYQPILKKVENNKPIRLDEKLLIVEGTVLSNDEFPKWISRLENFDWIKKVNVIHYGNLKTTTSFNIQILLI